MKAFQSSGNRLLDFGKAESAGNQSIFQRSFLRREEGSLLSTLPPREHWLKVGLVERRTVHANVIWRERQMILTKDAIYFARPNSDIVVDKISISEIISVGRVDNIERKSQEHSKVPSIDDFQQSWISTGTTGRTANGPTGNQRRVSVLGNVSKVESLEVLQDGLRETFAFEIKTASQQFYRSYFVRSTAQHDCDGWVEELNTSLKIQLREIAGRGNWLQIKQKYARDFYDSHVVRCFIAFAILCDFVSSVLECEFSGNSIVNDVFGVVDAILCTFFLMELSLSAFGNWTNFHGAPFVMRLSNWFLVATVLFQLSGFFLPDLDAKHLKIIRVIRLFDVGSAFKSLASCHMVLKAIRKGALCLGLPFVFSKKCNPCNSFVIMDCSIAPGFICPDYTLLCHVNICRPVVSLVQDRESPGIR